MTALAGEGDPPTALFTFFTRMAAQAAGKKTALRPVLRAAVASPRRPRGRGPSPHCPGVTAATRYTTCRCR